MADIKWSAFSSGGNMQVGDQTVGLRAGDNYRFDFPGTGIEDSSGNFMVAWTSVGANAVNYLTLGNAASGSPATLEAIGSDTNVNFTISAQGSGVVTVSSNLILNTSSPSTSLQAASKGYVDSMMPTYPVPLNDGGTNANLTASNGGIFYSTATAGAILSGTATAHQALLSGSSTAPAWSTATYPATTTANQLLYSSSNNTIGGLTSAANGVLVTSNTSVPSILVGTGVAGNILMTNTSSAPSWSTAIYSNTYTANNLLYASSANTVSGLATANSSVLITSGSGAPSLSTTLPSAVQGNITSLGTIGTGVWNGTAITGQYGGTGVNNGSSTMTIGGSLTFSGAYTFTGTLSANTSVTFPTSGTLATTSQLPSLPLSLANGGTNANLTASNGGIFYSSASAGAILAGTSTANQLLMSGSNTTPAWSTATYPSTNAINTLLYASSANVMAALATANSSVLVTNSSGVPSLSQTLPNGTSITGAYLSHPQITNYIEDSSGYEILAFTAIGNANYLKMLNAGTGVAPILEAAGSDTNVTLRLKGQGTGGAAILGTTAADNASAGYVGEFFSSVIASGSAVSCTTTVALNITSISLTAGDWDVWGNAGFIIGGTTTTIDAWISTSSATAPDSSLISYNNSTGLLSQAFCVPYTRVSISATTTTYLSCVATFTSSTCTAYGGIYARRVR